MNEAVCIVTTGGTIDKVYFDKKSSFEVGESTIESVLIQANVKLPFRIISLLKKDSLELTDEDRESIRATAMAQAENKIVVTHGTDTMVKSAQLLAAQQQKTVVFTGAMQPARFSTTDAIFNIGAALGAVNILPPGAYIVMNGKILDPFKAMKNVERDCFIEFESE